MQKLCQETTLKLLFVTLRVILCLFNLTKNYSFVFCMSKISFLLVFYIAVYSVFIHDGVEIFKKDTKSISP